MTDLDKFKPGAVVALNHGGPLMTVRAVVINHQIDGIPRKGVSVFGTTKHDEVFVTVIEPECLTPIDMLPNGAWKEKQK